MLTQFNKLLQLFPAILANYTLKMFAHYFDNTNTVIFSCTSADTESVCVKIPEI